MTTPPRPPSYPARVMDWWRGRTGRIGQMQGQHGQFGAQRPASAPSPAFPNPLHDQVVVNTVVAVGVSAAVVATGGLALPAALLIVAGSGLAAGMITHFGLGRPAALCTGLACTCLGTAAGLGGIGGAGGAPPPGLTPLPQVVRVVDDTTADPDQTGQTAADIWTQGNPTVVANTPDPNAPVFANGTEPNDPFGQLSTPAGHASLPATNLGATTPIPFTLTRWGDQGPGVPPFLGEPPQVPAYQGGDAISDLFGADGAGAEDYFAELLKSMGLLPADEVPPDLGENFEVLDPLDTPADNLDWLGARSALGGAKGASPPLGFGDGFGYGSAPNDTWESAARQLFQQLSGGGVAACNLTKVTCSDMTDAEAEAAMQRACQNGGGGWLRVCPRIGPVDVRPPRPVLHSQAQVAQGQAALPVQLWGTAQAGSFWQAVPEQGQCNITATAEPLAYAHIDVQLSARARQWIERELVLQFPDMAVKSPDRVCQGTHAGGTGIRQLGGEWVPVNPGTHEVTLTVFTTHGTTATSYHTVDVALLRTGVE